MGKISDHANLLAHHDSDDADHGLLHVNGTSLR